MSNLCIDHSHVEFRKKVHSGKCKKVLRAASWTPPDLEFCRIREMQIVHYFFFLKLFLKVIETLQLRKRPINFTRPRNL